MLRQVGTRLARDGAPRIVTDARSYSSWLTDCSSDAIRTLEAFASATGETLQAELARLA